MNRSYLWLFSPWMSAALTAAEPATSIPEPVHQAAIAQQADAVLLSINGRVKVDGTPYDATYIFKSPATNRQIWVQVPATGPPTATELDFPSDGLQPLPAKFPSLSHAVVEARRQGIVKGFETTPEGAALISASLMSAGNGVAWQIVGYDASGGVLTIAVPVDAAGAAQAAVQPPSDARLPPTAANVAKVLQQRVGPDAADVQVRVGKAGDILTLQVTGRVSHPGVKLQVRRAIDRWIDSPYDARYLDDGLIVASRLGLLGAGHPQGSDMMLPGRLQLSRDGARLMVFRSGPPQRIEVLDLATGRPAFSYAGPPLQGSRGFQALPLQALAADGQSGAAVLQGGETYAVQLFGPAGPTRGAPLDRRFVATALAAAVGGKGAAVGGYVPGEGGVLLLAGGRFEALSIEPPLGAGRCLLEFSPDGTQLAIAESETGAVAIWDVASRQETRRLTPAGLSATALAWSADGQRLAVGSHDGDGVLLCDLGDGSTQTLSGLPGKVAQLAFSPDGTQLASAQFNVGVGLWDVAARRLVNGLTIDDAGAEIVGFGDGGNLLYTGILTASGEFRRWDLRGTAAPANNTAPRGGVSAVLGLTRRNDPGGSLRLVVEYRVTAANQECELSITLRDAAGQPVPARSPDLRGPDGSLRAAWRFTPTEPTETSYHIFIIPRGAYPAGPLTAVIDLTASGQSLLPQPHEAAVPQK